MATPEQYLDDAAQYIGISGTDNIFNTWYWGFPCYDPNTYPWCACFQSYVGVHDLGMPFNASASAAGVAWQGERVLDSEARAGDWVLFNWDNRQDFGWADHIGVVEWTDINGSGYFGTIEGNTGNAYGGEVARCYRNNNGGYATAFFRPPYTGEEPEPMPEQYPGSTVNDAGLWYQSHVQNIGWCDWVRDGQTSGTVGFCMRLEGLRINPPEGWELVAKAHVQNLGWQRYDGITHDNGVVIGTTGRELQIEALIIEVVKRPDNAANKRLFFRVHQQNYGWKGWTEEGYCSGSDGELLRLEAVQMKIE